jgi:hypothetical protein
MCGVKVDAANFDITRSGIFFCWKPVITVGKNLCRSVGIGNKHSIHARVLLSVEVLRRGVSAASFIPSIISQICWNRVTIISRHVSFKFIGVPLKFGGVFEIGSYQDSDVVNRQRFQVEGNDTSCGERKAE